MRNRGVRVAPTDVGSVLRVSKWYSVPVFGVWGTVWSTGVWDRPNSCAATVVRVQVGVRVLTSNNWSAGVGHFKEVCSQCCIGGMQVVVVVLQLAP